MEVGFGGGNSSAATAGGGGGDRGEGGVTSSRVRVWSSVGGSGVEERSRTEEPIAVGWERRGLRGLKGYFENFGR